MKDRLTEDAENMEQIMSRLELTKDAIWQNRYIYWIAKAVYDLIRERRADNGESIRNHR